MTKGTVWNILENDFDVNKNYHILAKINMVMEFGEFLAKSSSPRTTILKWKINE